MRELTKTIELLRFLDCHEFSSESCKFVLKDCGAPQRWLRFAGGCPKAQSRTQAII